MSIARRIEELEAEVMRQGLAVTRRRIDARLARMTAAELTALRVALEIYARTGEADPALYEVLKELTT